MPSIIPTISAAGLGAIVLQPFPDVTPFTIREGATYESILSGIRVWIRDELVPYLQDNSAQAIFQSNVDTMIDTVNGALGDQAATVTAALNAAVQEIITADIPITGALFRTMGFVVAPAPSGGDDTAVLQELLTEAQATTGTVYLHAGTYRCNLETVSGVMAGPILQGRGERLTILQSFDNTKPTVKLQGTPGAVTGGGVRDLTIDGNGGIGLQHSGVGGTESTGLHIHSCSTAVEFFNDTSGSFTEFCVVEAHIASSTFPVRYRKNLGNESFHGSGLIGNSTINMAGNASAITIEDGCLPYNAPMSVTVFPETPGIGTVFTNKFPARTACSFYGTLRLENLATVADLNAGTGKVWYAGEILALAGTPTRLGNFYLVEKAYYGGNGSVAQYKPFQRVTTLQAGASLIVPDDISNGMIVAVDILGPNYHYAYQLLCWNNPYDGTGVVTVLANPFANNGNGVGGATFSMNHGLNVTNAAYSSQYSAYVSVTPLNAALNFDRLAQY